MERKGKERGLSKDLKSAVDIWDGREWRGGHKGRGGSLRLEQKIKRMRQYLGYDRGEMEKSLGKVCRPRILALSQKPKTVPTGIY